MCEIQFVMNPKGLTVSEKNSFIKQLKNGSSYNKDAWGMYFNGMIFKDYGLPSDKNPLFKKAINTLINDGVRFVVGHNRLATQGLTGNENNHPFETDNFVVVHNGMIRNDDELKTQFELEYCEQVDSYIIPALLEKFKKKYSEVELIRLIAEKISGTYSVIIYCKSTNNLYYFKNSGTYMYFRKSKNTLYFSTSDSSFDFDTEDDIWSIPMQEGNIEDLTLYKIQPNSVVINMGKFEEKKSTYDSYNSYYYGRGYSYGKSQKKVKLRDEIKELMEAEGYPCDSISKPIATQHKDISEYRLFLSTILTDYDLENLRKCFYDYPFIEIGEIKKHKKTTELIIYIDNTEIEGKSISDLFDVDDEDSTEYNNGFKYPYGNVNKFYEEEYGICHDDFFRSDKKSINDAVNEDIRNSYRKLTTQEQIDKDFEMQKDLNLLFGIRD